MITNWRPEDNYNPDKDKFKNQAEQFNNSRKKSNKELIKNLIDNM